MKAEQKVPLYRILVAFFVLPFTVLVGIPYLLHTVLPINFTRGLFTSRLLQVSSIIFALIGFGLLYATNLLFIQYGQGTLAPWNPPEKLVFRGPYRYMRQPMISGVLCVLLGEILLLASWASVIWFCVFLSANLIYIPLVEERALRERFGDEYRKYKAAVPGWLPRLRPWDGQSE